MSQITYCPECDSEIRFNRKPRLGHQTTCNQCGEELEVIGLRPLELDYVLEFDDDDDTLEFDSDGYELYERNEDWN